MISLLFFSALATIQRGTKELVCKLSECAGLESHLLEASARLEICYTNGREKELKLQLLEHLWDLQSQVGAIGLQASECPKTRVLRGLQG